MSDTTPPEQAPDPSSFDPADFPEANQRLGAPPDWTPEMGTCGILPVWVGEGCGGKPLRVSKWKLRSFRERLRILITGEIWLTVVMNGQPPVGINSETPFR